MGDKNVGRIMGINIPPGDNVINVEMGSCIILENDNKTHLITYGLGPCVGVAIVIKLADGKILRLLAHLDISQTIGMNFQIFRNYLLNLKQKITNKIDDIQIHLISSVSFIRYFTQKRLTENEEKLLITILEEFKDYNIGFNDLKINRNSDVTQVQISPSGKITKISDSMRSYDFELKMLPDFEVNIIDNIYVTKFGAYMGNCSIPVNCTEQEKKELLSRNYWQEYISKGYKLNIAPSFNDKNSMAVYLENWQNFKNDYGLVPGCLLAPKESTHSKHF